MTPAERMRKYRARKHLRAAWLRAVDAGLDPCQVMSVTPIGVTVERSSERRKRLGAAFTDLADAFDHARMAGRPS